jgi:predicted nuclease of predicted toxin-antitoxin system
MKLLANENFPLASVEYLLNVGFDIIAIGIEHPSTKDNHVMDIAIRQERTILTFDRDYGELIFKYNNHPPKGVIYLRLEIYQPNDPGKLIEELVQRKSLEFERALTVVDKNGIRQRKY